MNKNIENSNAVEISQDCTFNFEVKFEYEHQISEKWFKNLKIFIF